MLKTFTSCFCDLLPHSKLIILNLFICLDAHRQRIVNWINATGGTSSAFDVTTKVFFGLYIPFLILKKVKEKTGGRGGSIKHSSATFFRLPGDRLENLWILLLLLLFWMWNYGIYFGVTE